MFTRFGGISDTRVKAQIARGERIRALLTQPRFAGLRLADQVALLAALAEGVFDDRPVETVAAVRARLAGHLDANAHDAVAAVNRTGTLDDTTRLQLVNAVRALADIAAEPVAAPRTPPP